MEMCGLTLGYAMLIFTLPRREYNLGDDKMPIYEYRCKDCGTVFETIVSSFSNADKVVCKKCQSQEVEKQISTFASPLSDSKSAAPAGALSDCSCKSGFS